MLKKIAEILQGHEITENCFKEDDKQIVDITKSDNTYSQFDVVSKHFEHNIKMSQNHMGLDAFDSRNQMELVQINSSLLNDSQQISKNKYKNLTKIKTNNNRFSNLISEKPASCDLNNDLERSNSEVSIRDAELFGSM